MKNIKSLKKSTCIITYLFVFLISTKVYGWFMTTTLDAKVATMFVSYWSMPQILVTVLNEDKSINYIDLNNILKILLKNDSSEETIPISITSGGGFLQIEKLLHGDNISNNYIFSLDIDESLYNGYYEIQYEDLSQTVIEPSGYETTGVGFTTGEIGLDSSVDVYISKIHFYITEKQETPPESTNTPEPTTNYYYYMPQTTTYYETNTTTPSTSYYEQSVDTVKPQHIFVLNTDMINNQVIQTTYNPPTTASQVTTSQITTSQTTTTNTETIVMRSGEVLSTEMEYVPEVTAQSTEIKKEISPITNKKQNPKTSDYVSKFYVIFILLVGCILFFIKLF